MVKIVTVKKIRSPAPGNISNDIDFICKSLGYFSLRDKQETAGRIFRLLVTECCSDSEGLSSDDIAERLELSRGSIVHHLNSFISTGIVVKERNMYRLRSTSLQKCIDEIKEDINRIFKQMTKIANEIDEKLGHYYR
jgi:predicted transcriptional regulator